MKKEEILVLQRKLLNDCLPDKVFWMNNGKIIRNLYELVDSLETINDFHFKYHVNLDNNKNDFADWIRDAFDDKLAMQLEGIMDKKIYISILKKQIKKIENLV